MRRVFLASIAAGCFLFLVDGGRAQDAPAAGSRARLGPPKNLKILKPEEVASVMGAFMIWTGLKCGDCHAGQDFASDENPKKVVARRMLGMTRNINATTFEGEEKVTCYTCHRGVAHPPSTQAAVKVE